MVKNRNSSHTWQAQLIRSAVVTLVTMAFLAIVAALHFLGASHLAELVVTASWSFWFNVVLPASTVTLAAAVIVLQNMVHSLLCLIGVFLFVVVLFLGAGAEYLAFVFTVVYVGAVSILFLFVIMLINIRAPAVSYKLLSASQKLFLVAILVASALLVLRVSTAVDLFFSASDLTPYVLEPTRADTSIITVVVTIEDITIFSTYLYTFFCFLFFLIALLLLTAMLGAIVLAKGTVERKKEVVHFKVDGVKHVAHSRWGL